VVKKTIWLAKSSDLIIYRFNHIPGAGIFLHVKHTGFLSNTQVFCQTHEFSYLPALDAAVCLSDD